MGSTINDVAKLAGVSKSTVSRVLNNHPNISNETELRVKKAIKQLKYIPSNIGRNLANQKTNIVALILDIDNAAAFANPFFYQVQYGIEKVLCSNGYYLMIVNQTTLNEHEQSLTKLILEKRVDGIILPSSLLNRKLFKKMEEEKFPFIVLGEPNNIYDVNWIDIDNKLGGEIGTEHLIQEGYENIAFVSGSLQDTFNQHRLEGFKKIMNKYVRDLEFEKFVYDGVSTQEEGIQMIQKLFEQNQKTDAIIFTDNIAAFGAIKWLKEQGYQIPKDVGIISFDDYPIAELTDPKLTTVDIDVLDLGMQAGMMLLKEIEIPSESKKHSLLSVKLIQRESSKRRK